MDFPGHSLYVAGSAIEANNWYPNDLVHIAQ